jgi:RNA polymerase subunit RPABC4/transcription elongation factor Spt4
VARAACPNCGKEYDAARSICPNCGHDRSAPFQSFSPSIVITGPDAEKGGHVLKVADPGVQSETRKLSDGSITLDVVGATGIGRSGESRVALTLQESLVRTGHQVEIHDGEDARGIDRAFVVNGERFVFQVTIAPQASDFWQQASRSSATTQVPPPHAAGWVREAVIAKADAPAIQNAPVLLAVDARHAGVVAMPDLIQEYLGSYGDPVTEFGFASVWIVGPTADYCARLGRGRP